MKCFWLFNLIILLNFFHGYAQESVLERYIHEGLENNLALKMKWEDYHYSLETLALAKGLFLPDVSFNARYSVAGGGRIIEFPVGDLLNPVYSTLNQLTMSSRFVEIDNQEFSFLRPKEHETKLRLVQPVINTSLFYNRRIKENLVNSGKADAETFRRALVAEIKTAWYDHIKYTKIREIMYNAREILEENVRVNKSLYSNDKVTLDVVYRSEAELDKLIQQLAETEKAVMSSAAYFNFLLNRELLSPVDTGDEEPLKVNGSMENAVHNALHAREELSVLSSYQEAAMNKLKLEKANFFPEVLAVIDYGFQGARYRFTADDDFYMASLVLRWDIFKGRTNRAGIAQSRIEMEKIERQLEQTENAIRLEVINAWYSLKAAKEKIPAAESELRASEMAFRLVNRKYQQGQAKLIEFLDARNTLTNAETGLAIARYEYMASYAEFERAAGLYHFN